MTAKRDREPRPACNRDIFGTFPLSGAVHIGSLRFSSMHPWKVNPFLHQRLTLFHRLRSCLTELLIIDAHLHLFYKRTAYTVLGQWQFITRRFKFPFSLIMARVSMALSTPSLEYFTVYQLYFTSQNPSDNVNACKTAPHCPDLYRTAPVKTWL